jgi:ferritin-like metal-binding protein YciE
MEANNAQYSDPAVLKQHFVHHLNRVYHGKTYLQKHLPQLINHSSFKKLQQGIQEVLDDVNKQVGRIQEIYRLIEAEPTRENCVPIIAVFKDAFEPQDYDTNSTLLNDVDIILYLQLLEHINITSYRMLKILAATLDYQQALQLLTESFDESADNDKLFVMIADEYVKK